MKKSRGIFNTNLYWDATRAVLDKTGKMPIHYTTDPQVVQNVAALESRAAGVQFRGATCRFLQNRPRLRESYIQQAYVKLIERAEREVLIANAYFIPTPSLFTALTDAAKRCASVRLISNSPDTNDLPEITLVGRGYYKDLLAVNESAEVKACGNADAGLRIWEWVGQAPDEAGPQPGHDAFEIRGLRRTARPGGLVQPRSPQRKAQQRDGSRLPAARACARNCEPSFLTTTCGMRAKSRRNRQRSSSPRPASSSGSASPWDRLSRSTCDASRYDMGHGIAARSARGAPAARGSGCRHFAPDLLETPAELRDVRSKTIGDVTRVGLDPHRPAGAAAFRRRFRAGTSSRPCG